MSLGNRVYIDNLNVILCAVWFKMVLRFSVLSA